MLSDKEKIERLIRIGWEQGHLYGDEVPIFWVYPSKAINASVFTSYFGGIDFGILVRQNRESNWMDLDRAWEQYSSLCDLAVLIEECERIQ